MELALLRNEIDAIDTEMVKLLEKRLEVVDRIGRYKQSNNLPVVDKLRERQKLDELVANHSTEIKSYIRSLYSTIFDISWDSQFKKMSHKTGLIHEITQAIETTPKLFPQSASVMCQGTWGAYSQLVCDKLFTTPKIMFAKNFEGVFSAIEKGLCTYGVLPLENSTAGSVNRIYELMNQYKFHIVRCARLKIEHNLLARPGVTKEQIKEILSHEQALIQCEQYLKRSPGVTLTKCENTAVAAEMVANSGRDDLAALSSSTCVDYYGLECIETAVQDSANNYTRFICISKNLEIYPGADKTSLMMKVPHKPGALHKILSRFFILGINLSKLESHPLPGSDFEFMFYFDIDTSVYSDTFIQLMSELDTISVDFRYLGSYSEIT